MTPKITWWYLARLQLRVSITVSACFSAVIFLFDLAEILRKLPPSTRVGIAGTIAFALCRLPIVLFNLLSYVYYIASSLVIYYLSKSQQINALRTAGRSNVQILSPFVTVGVLLGIFWMFVFKPFSSSLNKHVDELENRYFGSPLAKNQKENLWFYQQTDAGETVIYVKAFGSEKPLGDFLKNVSIYNFDARGAVFEKMVASRVEAKEGFWLLKKGAISFRNSTPESFNEHKWRTNLSFQNLALSAYDPNDLGIYDLLKILMSRKKVELIATHHESALYFMIANALLFPIMALVSAAFCLHLTRYKARIFLVGKITISGIAIHVIMDFFRVMGSDGTMGPFVASTIPIVILAFLSVAFLIRREG